MSTSYFNYTFYIKDKSEGSKLSNLINDDESNSAIKESLKKIGFIEHLDDYESVEHLKLTKKGLNMCLTGHKVNAKLLVASKKIGCEFVHVNIDYEESGEDQYYHRGQLVKKEHIGVLLKVYDPETLASTDLYQLIETRDLNALQQAVKKGLDLDSTVNDDPLLHEVCNNRPVFDLFLDNGADLNVKDQYGYTLLMKLLEENEREKADIVLKLLEKGVDITEPMVDEGGSMLLHAMPFGKVVVDEIKKRGGEYLLPDNAYGNDIENNATIAITYHDNEKLSEMLSEASFDEDVISELSDESIAENNVAALELLMDKGYDLFNKNNDSNLIDLLESALYSNSLDMARYLIDKVATSEFKLSKVDDETIAELAGNPLATDILKILIESSDSILEQGPNSNGLVNAIDADAIENAKVLINAGCKLEDNSDEDYIVSLLAANIQKLTAPMAQLLINAGADPFLKTHKSSEYFEEQEDELLNDKSAIHLVLKENKNKDPELLALFNQLQSKLPAEKQIWQVIDQGNLNELKPLFAQCEDKNLTNELGESLLQVAVTKNDVKIVAWLLQQNVEINNKDNDGNTALSKAVILESANIVKLLLDAGADANDCVAYPDDSNENKEDISEEELDKIMDAIGLGVENEIDKEKERLSTPIKIEGNDANCLMQAANNGNLPLVKTLLNHGADIEAKDTSGRTAIYFSAENGHLNCLKFLHENGAEPEIHIKQKPLEQEFGESYSIEFKDRHILEAAAYRGHIDVCKYLVNECGIDINLKSKSSKHCAIISAAITASFFEKELMRPLLELGADPNSVIKQFSMSRSSVLQVCVLSLNPRGAKTLIEYGADRDKLNIEGSSAYDLVIEVLGENAAQVLGFDLEDLKPIKSSTKMNRIFKQSSYFVLFIILPAMLLIGAVYYFSETWAKYLAIAFGLFVSWSLVSPFFKKENEEELEEVKPNPFAAASEVIGKAIESSEEKAKKDKELLDKWEEA